MFYRWFDNRRQVGSYFGLTGMPYDSGASRREQGISKAGNWRARKLAIELAWLWVRHQPDSDLTCWFRERVGNLKGRIRRIAIVALARKALSGNRPGAHRRRAAPELLTTAAPMRADVTRDRRVTVPTRGFFHPASVDGSRLCWALLSAMHERLGYRAIAPDRIQGDAALPHISYAAQSRDSRSALMPRPSIPTLKPRAVLGPVKAACAPPPAVACGQP